MEEKHNFLYATLAIIGISFIGIIASAYYFQINESQKKVISLYESQKIQEEEKSKALVAKNKHKAFAKNDKVNNSIKSDKSKDKSSKFAENNVQSHKTNQQQKKDNNTMLKPNELVKNKLNKDELVSYNNIEKKSYKSYSKKKSTKKCNKVKKYCPIRKTKEASESKKTYIQPSHSKYSAPNAQTIVTKPVVAPQNYSNAPAVVQSNESNSLNTYGSNSTYSQPELREPPVPSNP